MKTNLLISAVVLSGSFFLLACGGPKDVDKIADAQNCLDHAAASEVADCVSKVDGMESESAYLIRCVGKFAKEGFNDPAKLANALSGSSNNSGTSGSTAMMAALAFKTEASSALNSASAAEASVFCGKAKSNALMLLSNLTKAATAVGYLAGKDLTNLTGDDLKQAMGTLQNDPVAQEAVGTAVTTIYQTNCSGSSSTTGDFCKQFDAAVTTIPGGLSNPTGLGQQIMKCYNDPTASGCTGFQ